MGIGIREDGLVQAQINMRFQLPVQPIEKKMVGLGGYGEELKRQGETVGYTCDLPILAWHL